MKRKKQAIAVVALCLAATFGSFVYLSKPEPSSSNAKRVEELNKSSAAPSPASPHFQADIPAPPQSSEPELDAIKGEAVLTFQSADALDAFLKTANARGFDRLQANRTLLSVRLFVSPDEAQSLRRSIGSDAQWDSNYTMLIPIPVDPNLDYGNESFEGRALRFIGTPDDRSTLGAGLTIAVLDSGVLPHSTLNGVSIEHFDTLTQSTPSDQGSNASHGTAVASLIAGQNGNGVAPAAKLLSIRVLDADGIGDTFSLATGIVEAVDRGANIINMSLGSFGTNAALDNAIAYADAHGVVLVAAAGNDGVNLLPYPASYDSVIAVSSIDAAGHATQFANQGEGVDIAAPGVGVYAAWGEEEWISFTGTSASTPYVAGAIAAVSSELGIEPAAAAALLLDNANDTGRPGRDPMTGAGYISLERTLNSNTPGIRDLALADIFLDSTPDELGKYTAYVTVQNRGTEPLSSSRIALTLRNGITQTAYLGPLAPGESASHEISLTESELRSEQGYTLRSRAETSGPDQNPDNDQRAASLQLPPPTVNP